MLFSAISLVAAVSLETLDLSANADAAVDCSDFAVTGVLAAASISDDVITFRLAGEV
ncbi:hypothetical protein [Thalassospira australica]|uniref:hypothetical protein n=1 Tax=Thalassospira australica TaxID=1528106 RepID=UPI000B041BE4|nr:hypothetical protein [Thalassospira australica]